MSHLRSSLLLFPEYSFLFAMTECPYLYEVFYCLRDIAYLKSVFVNVNIILETQVNACPI